MPPPDSTEDETSSGVPSEMSAGAVKGAQEPEDLIRELREVIQERKKHASQTGSLFLGTPSSVATHLSGARRALDRASAKHSAAKAWPRLVRGFRRNQDAFNEALLDAMTGLLKANDRLRQKLESTERRLEEIEKETSATGKLRPGS